VLDGYILVVWHGDTKFTVLSKTVCNLTRLAFFSYSWILL